MAKKKKKIKLKDSLRHLRELKEELKWFDKVTSKVQHGK
jgi:hypothetical protein